MSSFTFDAKIQEIASAINPHEVAKVANNLEVASENSAKARRLNMVLFTQDK